MDNLEMYKEPQKIKASFFKSKLFLILLAVFIIGAGTGGYLIIKHNNEVKAEADKAKKEAKKAKKYEEEYIQLLSNTTETIHKFNTTLEGIANYYVKVWGNSIDNDLHLSNLAKYLGVEESSLEAVAPSGKLKSDHRGKYIEQGDFNTAILIVYGAIKNAGLIDQMTQAQTSVLGNVKGLNSPPPKYKEIYEEVLNYYTTAEKLLDLAMIPSGSYLTYPKEINSLSTELESQYNRIQASMPN